MAALDNYKKLYSFAPPGWAKSFFVENNQAITENLAAMSMNYFAFFPALINPASNPNAAGTGFFANPAGPDGDQFAALGGQGISIVSYSPNHDEAKKFLQWFIQDDVQKRWAELGGYTCSAPCWNRPNSATRPPVTRPSIRPCSRSRTSGPCRNMPNC